MGLVLLMSRHTHTAADVARFRQHLRRCAVAPTSVSTHTRAHMKNEKKCLLSGGNGLNHMENHGLEYIIFGTIDYM